ncbi:hypothetical protein IFM89_019995 [Coptis chinensis]|uniref:Uncharacterized protein n=1 Tax=Coptis chinensis TaxID=261450 RepID=A0A835I032_9MAGN|nr:hypothetical protein IFM89_019995 [Coptis chinensis]
MWKRKYTEVWKGIPSREQWDIECDDERILPPEGKRQVGHPPTVRMKFWPSRKGPKQERHCTLCREKGHNKMPCKNFVDDKGATYYVLGGNRRILWNATEARVGRSPIERRNRIEPPLHALRRDPYAPRPRPDPNAPCLPNSTSALTGPRLSLHNRVHSLIRAGDML